MSHDEAGEVKRDTLEGILILAYLYKVMTVSMATSDFCCEMRHTQSSMDPAQPATYMSADCRHDSYDTQSASAYQTCTVRLKLYPPCCQA